MGVENVLISDGIKPILNTIIKMLTRDYEVGYKGLEVGDCG